MAELSIVIVTFHSAGEIESCLRAALECSDDVTVIDNASRDNTVARALAFGTVNVVANPENRGFAGGVNQGVQLARHDTILVLNPDVILQNNPQPLAAACHVPGYGAAAGMLLGSDGGPQRGFNIRRLPTAWSLAFEVLGVNRILPRNPVNRRWRASDLDAFAPQDVEQPAGAFLAFRREAWEVLGGFDSRFHPVWFEDVDFCRRMLMSGLHIRYVPEVRAAHSGAASIARMAPGDREVQWYVSLLRYSATAFGFLGRLGVAAAVALAAMLRWCWSAIHPTRWCQLKAYPKVLMLAIRETAEAVLGKGVKGETVEPAWSRTRAASSHTEATDTQANVP